MEKTILLILSLLLVCSTASGERTIYVDANGTADFNNVQAAIEDANNGDTVIVYPGTYTGEGNRDIDFLGKAITVRSLEPNNPDIVAATVIDCNGSKTEQHRGFYFHNEESEDSILAGLTIKNGYGGRDGGAVSCEGSSYPRIKNCNPTIKNCVIRDNFSFRGGGINCSSYSSPKISNCIISGNSAYREGGGINCSNFSNPKISNCIISGNSAFREGGGIYSCCGSNPTVINSIICNNYAQDGAGIYNDSKGTITNCTIVGNVATSNGGGVYDCYGPITNCIIWDNEPDQLYNSSEPTYSCIEGGSSGEGNIDTDPCFVDADANDYHLSSASLCINAGGFNSYANQTDIDGQPRVMGYPLIIDIGADEFFAPTIIVNRPTDGDLWITGSTHEITWQYKFYEGNVNILFSADEGSTWQSVAENIPGTGEFLWNLPEHLDSTQSLISVEPNIPDPNIIIIPSGLFSIGPDITHQPINPKWKSLGGDFDRSGLSTNFGPELGCIKWKFETGGAVSSSVTASAGNRIHIACEDGNLYTLNSRTGSLYWSYDTNTPLLSSPTVGLDGSVYVGGRNNRLYAISFNGSPRWTFATDGFISSSPAVAPDDSAVYACSQDGNLYALGHDGSELWKFTTKGPGKDLQGSILGSPAVGDDGTIYLAGVYDPNLYALEPNDGSVKWNCRFDSDGWAFASPVIGSGGAIYQMLLYDPNLYAIEPNDGSIMWATNLADPCSGLFEPNYLDIAGNIFGLSEPVIGPDGTIYVSFDDPYLRAVNPDGTIKWVTRLGTTGGFTLTTGRDGLIYAASDDQYLSVVSHDGEELSNFTATNWLNYPVIPANNMIIVSGSEDGSVLISGAENAVWALSKNPCHKEYDLHRPEDLSGDLAIDLNDYAYLAAYWLNCSKSYPSGDIDRDSHTDAHDLQVLAEKWLINETGKK
jgi:outer membrane protein assembly factor BamB